MLQTDRKSHWTLEIRCKVMVDIEADGRSDWVLETDGCLLPTEIGKVHLGIMREGAASLTQEFCLLT